MSESANILGLPLTTFFIGGGLFVLSTFLPTILTCVIDRRKEKRHE